MELAIHKREDISIKYSTTKSMGRDGRQKITNGELCKIVNREKSKLKKIETHLQETQQSVTSVREELSAVKLVLKDTSAEYNATAQLKESLGQEVAELEFEKNRLLSMCDL